MPETVVLLEPGFSTTDAEYPDFALRGNTLFLDFVGWHGQHMRVRFDDIAGVRWDECESDSTEPCDDCVYAIVDSEWVKRLHHTGGREPTEVHRHFKLCFNANGPLEVLATDMRLAEDGEV